MKLYQFYDKNEFEDYYYVLADNKDEALDFLKSTYDYSEFELSETYELEPGLIIH